LPSNDIVRLITDITASSNALKSDQIREDDTHGACGTHGYVRNAYRNLVGKSEKKRPRGRSWRRWDGDIRKELREIVWKVVDWIYLAEGRDKFRAFVNTVMNLRVP
jgi:hypothetical protein